MSRRYTIGSRRLLLLSIATSCFILDAFAGGKSVVLTLKDSTSVSGELLSVRSQALVLARDPWLAEEQLKDRPDLIVVIALDRVSRIQVAGHPNPGLGGRVGIGVGMLTGAILGYNAPVSSPSNLASDRSLNAEMGAVMGVLPGFVAGTVIGTFIETDGTEFAADDTVQIQLLPKAARYPLDEPDFLIQITSQ